jgi:hypothetical protein
MFAYQKRQQTGLFLKDLIPLAAIGRAYVWSDREQDNETTDYRTTSYGKEQRAGGKRGKVKGQRGE